MSLDIRPQALEEGHFSDARLYANREQMVRTLIPNGVRAVCEIGVAFGDFSEFLIDTLRPRTFVAVDLFEIHKLDVVWGRSTSEIFKDLTHRQFYENRFRDSKSKLVILEGMSAQTLPTLEDASLDLIYVDASHDYEGVKRDAEISLKKIRPDGTLIFNDYTLFDPSLRVEYGVVQAVNELVVKSDWRIVGLSLQRHMFCDIALRRM